MTLKNSKHELFAQGIVKGLSPADAYIKAGYAPAGARFNAHRLITNDNVSARIKELKGIIAQGVIAAEIRKRSWRVQQLQDWADDMLALRAARKVLYANQLSEGYEFQVDDADEEARALAEGCRVAPRWEPVAPEAPQPPKPPAPGRAEAFHNLFADNHPPGSPQAVGYPKTMVHPGFPNGGATGMLVKDYRGKNAEQEIWKFDAALVARFNETLKQAAIEEGQWTEKRQLSGGLSMSVIKARLNAGRQRVADAKRAAEARKQ